MTDQPATRERSGKPKLENKRGSLTIRLRDEVRSELERCAFKYGRSLSEEMEARMELSLSQKPQLNYEWGDDCFRLATAMAAALSRIEDWSGKNWIEDSRTAEIFKKTLPQIAQNYLDIIRRQSRNIRLGDFDEMNDEELADAFAALSGVAPPRPKRPPVEMMVSDD